MGGTADAIDVNHGKVLGATNVVWYDNPHSIVWVRLVSNQRKPVHQSTLVSLIVKCEQSVDHLCQNCWGPSRLRQKQCCIEAQVPCLNSRMVLRRSFCGTCQWWWKDLMAHKRSCGLNETLECDLCERC